ncbi:hypothetical protein HDU76_011779, partial [Blyttiomyces sp. JEL0837]
EPLTFNREFIRSPLLQRTPGNPVEKKKNPSLANESHPRKTLVQRLIEYEAARKRIEEETGICPPLEKPVNPKHHLETFLISEETDETPPTPDSDAEGKCLFANKVEICKLDGSYVDNDRDSLICTIKAHINGVLLQETPIDTCSSHNVVDFAYIQRMGPNAPKIIKADRPSFCKGVAGRSAILGHCFMQVAPDGKDKHRKWCRFSVVSNLPKPALLGTPFFRAFRSEVRFSNDTFQYHFQPDGATEPSAFIVPMSSSFRVSQINLQDHTYLVTTEPVTLKPDLLYNPVY